MYFIFVDRPLATELSYRLLVTELCNGTLVDLVKGRCNSLQDGSNWLILRQIVVGLYSLHTNKPINVIHRNLNPRNILFVIEGSSDQPVPVMKLADFGLSRTLPKGRPHLTRTQLMDGYSIEFRPFGTDGWNRPHGTHGWANEHTRMRSTFSHWV